MTKSLWLKDFTNPSVFKIFLKPYNDSFCWQNLPLWIAMNYEYSNITARVNYNLWSTKLWRSVDISTTLECLTSLSIHNFYWRSQWFSTLKYSAYKQYSYSTCKYIICDTAFGNGNACIFCRIILHSTIFSDNVMRQYKTRQTYITSSIHWV